MKVRYSYELIMNMNILCINLFVLFVVYVFILCFLWSGIDIIFEENWYFEDVKKIVCVDLLKVILEVLVVLIGILFSFLVLRLIWRILLCVLLVISIKLFLKMFKI